MIKRLIRETRALMCETLHGWSIAVCPEDYTPSYIAALLVAKGVITEKQAKEELFR